jgi:hypothetical protein
MKRLIAGLSAATVLLAAGAAAAADVSVTIGPELQHHSRAYGDSEIAGLKKDLTEAVQRALAKPGAVPVQRVDLVLESATPNRPTFNEMGAFPGLSLSSLGVGGAVISGTVTGPDGVARPILYQWRETDIHRVRGYSTWTDAELAFDRLADELRRGKAPNDGHFRPDLTSAAAFDGLNRLRQY